MAKYSLTADNGQVMEMNIIDQNTTIDNEISKLEELFTTLTVDDNGVPPSGWQSPLPTRIVSYEQI